MKTMNLPPFKMVPDMPSLNMSKALKNEHKVGYAPAFQKMLPGFATLSGTRKSN